MDLEILDLPNYLEPAVSAALGWFGFRSALLQTKQYFPSHALFEMEQYCPTHWFKEIL